MKSKLLIAAAALALAAPAGVLAQAAGAVAESPQPNSTVSVLVEPQLSDGRLILKVAAKNSSTAPVQFGPANVQISTPGGIQIGIYPLNALVNDVREAAGMEAEAPGGAPTSGAYASPQLNVRDGGRIDVTGYTGGAAVAQSEQIRRSQRRTTKPAISQDQANAQIASLRAAILTESTVAPGQIVAGQIVSQKLDFGKDANRTLHVRVQIAGDEHSFTIAAPSQ